ncbi:hypothetical protein L0337_14625 [candidate division KSB1 bacterium]|nr:hypothetical protein [candidate division KSB1 bacterium]
MSRVAVYIDGGYLDSVLRDEFGSTRIDYAAFSREIAAHIHPDAHLLRTYYYHCPPSSQTGGRCISKMTPKRSSICLLRSLIH